MRVNIIKILSLFLFLLSPLVHANIITSDIDKAEYYFWYGCERCNAHNDEITSILKAISSASKTETIPAISSNKRWISAAKAFYLGQNTHEPDKFHKLMFKLVHIRGIDIMDKKTFMRVMDIYEKMPNEVFNSLYLSTPMNDLIGYAKHKTNTSKITSVPTIRIIFKNGESRNYSFSDKPSGLSFTDWINE